MPWKYNNTIIRAGKAWTDDNSIRHPNVWMRWTDDEKTAAGLVWEDVPASEARFDNRFYSGRQADGTLIPKALNDVNAVDEDGNAIMEDGEQVVTLGLKSNAIAQTKVTAGELLAPTDWMVIRLQEDSSKTLSTAVTNYRNAVRTASGTIETAITDAADLAAFMTLYDTPVSSDGNPTGNAPINDWPETT
tara:strand:+ start:23 stop:592 length:570 start_codon:yes stop_codon:yes gene_type:complete